MENRSLSRRSVMTAAIPASLLALSGAASFAQVGKASTDNSGDGKLAKLFRAGFENGEYKLPPLPYASDALEPHIDKATMELHHGKHHQSYVTNLNKALQTLAQVKGAEIEPSAVEALQRDISFNAGGHFMHTLFWGIMGPDAGGTPVGTLATAIDKTFGSFDNFKSYFTKVALSIKGSGWGVLAVDPISGQLMTFAMGDQDTRLAAGAIPLVAIDVWEHAYYLKYQNKRADYIAAWFSTIDWKEVELLFASHSHAM